MSQQSILQLARGVTGYRSGDNCWRFAGSTQTLAAALAANSVLYSMRAAPNTPGNIRGAYIERVRLQYTCLVSFTTPITAGRGLTLIGLANSTATGGAAVTAQPKGSNSSNIVSVFDGTTLIATTGALGVVTGTGRPVYGYASLAGLGNAGDRATFEWTFSGGDTAPIAVSNGGGINATLQNFGVGLSQAMDAAGQFELAVEVDTCELPLNYVPEF